MALLCLMWTMYTWNMKVVSGLIINVDEVGPDVKKRMVEGMEVIELCDDGIRRVVWQVPRTVDGDWQCL